MKLSHLLMGIVVCLTFLLWQSMETQPARVAAAQTVTESMDIQDCINWTLGNGSRRNRICPGTVAFGDEVVIGSPGEVAYGNVAAKMYCTVPFMACVMSDIGNYGWQQNNQIVAIVGHRCVYDCPSIAERHDTALFLAGRDGWPSYAGTEYTAGWIQWGIGSTKICFGPLYPFESGEGPDHLDACVERLPGPFGEADMKISSGGQYVLLSELVKLVGR